MYKFILMLDDVEVKSLYRLNRDSIRYHNISLAFYSIRANIFIIISTRWKIYFNRIMLTSYLNRN